MDIVAHHSVEHSANSNSLYLSLGVICVLAVTTAVIHAVTRRTK